MAALLLAGGLLAPGLLAAGCGSGPSPQQASSQRLNVVASTSVWGSVAGAVAGNHAQVKSIITSPVDDPHSYEASASDSAAVSDAQLVVYNGGGYDHFVDDALKRAPAVKRVDAFAVGGHAAEDNPHVFYDLATVSAVAKAVADRLAAIDGPNAADYRANADKFTGQVNGISSTENAIAAAHSSVPIVATEDVPHYLIAAAKLADRTPEGYYRAVDADSDPAPADMAAMLDLINTHGVRVVMSNPQTATSATQRIIDAAKAANVAIVNVTETLPENTDFITWQTNVANQLGSALQSG